MKDAMIKNLLPHDVTISGKNFPSEGFAKIEETIFLIGNVDNIDVVTSYKGAIIGLPPEKKGVNLIVSKEVKKAAMGESDRCDLFTVGQPIFNKKGKVTGYKNLMG